MRVRLLIVAAFVASVLLAVSAAFGAGLLHETAASAQLTVAATDRVNVTPLPWTRAGRLTAAGARVIWLRPRSGLWAYDTVRRTTEQLLRATQVGRAVGSASASGTDVVWQVRRKGMSPQVRLLDADVGHVTQLAAGVRPAAGGTTVAWVVRARGGDVIDVLDWVTDERAAFPAGGHVRHITEYGGWVAWTARQGAGLRLWSARMSEPGTRTLLGGGATALAMNGRRTVWAVPAGVGRAELMAWDHGAAGHAVKLARVPGPVTSLTLSQGWAAWTRVTAAGADVWTVDLANGQATPVTRAPGDQVSPVFVNGTLYWADNGSGHWELCARTLHP
jgi:hypothetical protein